MNALLVSEVPRRWLEDIRFVLTKDGPEAQVKLKDLQVPPMKYPAKGADIKCAPVRVTNDKGAVYYTMFGMLSEEDIANVRVVGNTSVLHLHTSKQYDEVSPDDLGVELGDIAVTLL